MFHPGVRLALWGAAVVHSQWLEGWSLAAATGAAGLLACVVACGRFAILLRRARWLLLALLVFFFWGTPGAYLWPELGRLGPTVDGAALGATHLARLFVVLALVAVLLQTTAVPTLVSGLFDLLRPLASLGFARERIAVRLMLVLHYADRRGKRPLREWLHPDAVEAEPGVATIRLSRHRLRPTDVGALLLVTALSAWVALA